MPESDVFNKLAYEFAERFRRGERPSLAEYTELYPELADEIRDLFPTLAMMEQLGTGGDRPSDHETGRSQHRQSMPDRLGDYRILREIGRGGMGVVYEAVQESLGRHVALKVLSHSRQLGPIQLIRFQREARAAALLHHTNIVPVFGVGVHEDVHYYAMQYIQGQGLDSVLRELIRVRGEAIQEKSIPDVEPDNLSASLASGLLTRGFQADPVLADAAAIVPAPAEKTRASSGGTVPTGKAVVSSIDASSSSSSILGHKEAKYFRSLARLGMQAAEALAYAHSHGVVHRDIKPANLLLDLQGTIWVTDFGLAKAEGSDELTSTGDVVGTLRYMAPERLQGKADARCDLYSLGVTLYEMLTLKPAFTASYRAQLVSAILHVEPVRPRKLDPQIPRDLETIVLKAIAKNPADRFSTAGEMARELGRFADGRPIHSRRASAPERLWRWSRRNPAVALLTLLAAILTTVLAIGSTAAAWKFREQRDAVQREQQNTQAKLGESLLLQARAMRYSGQPGRRAGALDILTKAAVIARDRGAPRDHIGKLRDEVIATLAEVDERQMDTLAEVDHSWEDVSFSFDSDRYVVLEPNRSFHLLRLSDQSEIGVVKTNSPSSMAFPSLVSGGRFVFVWSDPAQVDLWDLKRGKVPEGWPLDVRGAAHRPVGRQVAALRSNGELRVYDLPALTEVVRIHVGSEFPRRLPYEQMALSRDGRYLALMHSSSKHAWVYEIPSGRVVLELKLPMARVYSTLALSPNGALLAITHDRSISVYDVAGGERLSLLQAHQSEGIIGKFHPASNLLATASWDGTTRLWDPVRGRLLVTLRGIFLDWRGSESEFFIWRGKEIVVHRISPAAERRTIDCRMLSEQAGTALYGPARVAFSPDGQMIALALRPEGVRVVRASDGAGLAQLPIGNCDEVLFLSDRSLLTFNDRGLCRWQVRQLQGGRLRMGPPESLAPMERIPEYIPTGLASSFSGRLVGAVYPTRQGSMLLDPEQPRRRTWLLPHQGVNELVISPDGRWAATAGGNPSPESWGVKVWDATSGQLRVEFQSGHSVLAFSPDSQWLGVGGEFRYEFFATGSWTVGAQIDHGGSQGASRIAFHPGSQIAAILDLRRSAARLTDVKTGRLLAYLESPNESSIYCIVFSPDGRYLAISRTDQKIDLWDLSSIRLRLEELNLAEGLPDAFGGSATDGDVARIDRVEVQGVDQAGLRLLAVRQTLREAGFAFRGLLDAGLADAEESRTRAYRWLRLGQWRRAAADFRASLARRPDSASTANSLAWCLSSVPGRGDADEAVRWAQKAVELEPGNADYRNTLGAALYRDGRFAESAVELERDIASNPPQVGLDWVFLAMCKERLGLAAEARLALGQASRWSRERSWDFPDQVAEFHALLHEAQTVLDDSLPDFPSTVFDR
jgi:serine/threonine protein kinase/WD40 repeat protein